MQEKIKVEEISKTKYKISINIPPSEVDQKFNAFFESIKKQAEVPGFRKGKAPVERLKTLYFKQAKSPVAQSIIGEYYPIALSEHSINPVGSPRVENLDEESRIPGKFGLDNSYEVELTVETLPNVDPVGYKGLELDIPKVDSEALFDAKILGYREQFAERNQVTDRGIQKGDSVVIDFKGYVDGVAFEGGEAQGYSIEKLGSANFIPGFEEQLEGMEVSDDTREINVIFPEKYHAEHLAGKDAKFEVKVHNIVENKLASVDDDLAMMVGYESVGELNEKIQEEVQKEHKLAVRQAAEIQVVQKLLEINPFDAPESMVVEEFNRIMGRVKQQNQDIPPQVVDQIRQNSEFTVKRAIIMDAIYNKEESLEVAPEELNELLEHHAKMANKTKDEIVSSLYNSGQMDNFVGVLRVGKVVDFIIENANQESEVESGTE